MTQESFRKHPPKSSKRQTALGLFSKPSIHAFFLSLLYLENFLDVGQLVKHGTMRRLPATRAPALIDRLKEAVRREKHHNTSGNDF